ncbi:MAG TPA: DNA-protecting protein DprA, partial [Planctomycetota bacterium]|nr:DNA-protecting protein DprA [Planctomycetota bacterium]
QGAKLIEGVEDILDELNVTSPAREALVGARLAQSLSANEKSLLSILDTSDSLNIDDIIDRVKLPSALVLTTLLTLEMKKLVRQLPGKSYVRTA